MVKNGTKTGKNSGLAPRLALVVPVMTCLTLVGSWLVHGALPVGQ